MNLNLIAILIQFSKSQRTTFILIFEQDDGKNSLNPSDNDITKYTPLSNILAIDSLNGFIQVGYPLVDKNIYFSFYSYGDYQVPDFEEIIFNTSVHYMPIDMAVAAGLTLQTGVYAYRFKSISDHEIAAGYGMAVQFYEPTRNLTLEERANELRSYYGNEINNAVPAVVSVFPAKNAEEMDGFVSKRVTFADDLCNAMKHVPQRFRDDTYIYASLLQFVVTADAKVSLPFFQPLKFFCPAPGNPAQFDLFTDSDISPMALSDVMV